MYKKKDNCLDEVYIPQTLESGSQRLGFHVRLQNLLSLGSFSHLTNWKNAIYLREC